ncbi:MAG: hypothetical protein OEV28_10160 [Nitrospirota bacterium]|nr:hypothetical protein [Nitrospirota bacterium]
MEKVAEKATAKGIETGFEMGTEMFNALVKAQKEFIPTLVKGQKDVAGCHTEATKKLQGAFVGLCNFHEAPLIEMFNQYNILMSTMIKSSEIVTEEAEKIQAIWASTAEKQLASMKSFSTLYKLPTAAK